MPPRGRHAAHPKASAVLFCSQKTTGSIDHSVLVTPADQVTSRATVHCTSNRKPDSEQKIYIGRGLPKSLLRSMTRRPNITTSLWSQEVVQFHWNPLQLPFQPGSLSTSKGLSSKRGDLWKEWWFFVKCIKKKKKIWYLQWNNNRQSKKGKRKTIPILPSIWLPNISE